MVFCIIPDFSLLEECEYSFGGRVNSSLVSKKRHFMCGTVTGHIYMDYFGPVTVFLLRKNVEVIFNFLMNFLHSNIKTYFLYNVIEKQSEETEEGRKEESCF